MLMKTRQRGMQTEVLFKAPVNAMSRDFVHVELDAVRHCVVPLIRDKGGRPVLEGSAVALIYRDRHCLVTALHLLERNEDRPLIFFGDDTCAKPLRGNFQISKERDIAVTLLDDESVAALTHVSFLGQDRIGPVLGSNEKFYCGVVGYPHTASRLKDRQSIHTPMDIYCGRGTIRDDGSVAIAFDKDEGAWGPDGHTNPRDPTGKSGGAIFGMRTMGLNAVDPRSRAMLVGIPTDWKDKQIIGAGLGALLPLLDALTPG